MIIHTKILAIDADQQNWAKIGERLEKNGYDLLMAENAEEALQVLQQQQRVELVLVANNVLDIDYLELVKRIREDHSMPVIVVSERDDTIEEVVGLEIGAADFISKPFSYRELAARIKANLRLVHETEEKVLEKVQAGQDKISVIEFGRWVLDRNKMRVVEQKDKKPVNLTAGEYQVLEALVLSGGKVLSRERLFELTRDEDFEAYDRAIDIQIARIRKKLNDDSKHPKFIKTVRGAGYMLDVKIKKPA